jgi:hypothetical protein
VGQALSGGKCGSAPRAAALLKSLTWWPDCWIDKAQWWAQVQCLWARTRGEAEQAG